MDFQGPYPNGEYIFVVIDRYSHWPEIAFFRQPPTAKTTVYVMQGIFANKGIPMIYQSDNGQQFQISRDEVIRVETYNTRVTADKWNYRTIQQMHERSHTSRTRGRETNARCSHNLPSVLPSESTYDNKDKPICSYARRTRASFKGRRSGQMQKKKNKLTTVFNPTPLTVTDIKGSMITASTCDWSSSIKVLQTVWEYTTNG